ncbi:MAG: flagellar protein FlgN [Rhodobacteraceae bacterium]|nr:flagellar protein FlgN [Paracoccaceae bacterium]
MNDTLKTVELLERLFDLEGHAIRAGSFSALTDLATRKEELAKGLAGAPAEALERLRARALSNQRLLAAALKGVRAAQRRLDLITRASRSLSSYDALGRARTVASGGPNIERRA